MKFKHKLRLVIGIVSVLLCVVSLALGQSPRTIRVAGHGVGNGSPNFAQVAGTFSGTGDTAEKAIADHREKRNKLEKLFADAKDQSLQVEFQGEKLSSGMAIGADGAVALPFGGGIDGAGIAAGGGKFTVTEDISLRLNFENDMERTQALKKLTTEIDRLSKSGIEFGGSMNTLAARMGLGAESSIVHFGLAEEAQLRDKAYQAAFKDARQRAEGLAKLAGGKLGRVVSISEAEVADDLDSITQMQVQVYSSMFGGGSQPAANAIDHNGKIEIEQKLEVTFELE